MQSIESNGAHATSTAYHKASGSKTSDPSGSKTSGATTSSSTTRQSVRTKYQLANKQATDDEDDSDSNKVRADHSPTPDHHIGPTLSKLPDRTGNSKIGTTQQATSKWGSAMSAVGNKTNTKDTTGSPISLNGSQMTLAPSSRDRPDVGDIAHSARPVVGPMKSFTSRVGAQPVGTDDDGETSPQEAAPESPASAGADADTGTASRTKQPSAISLKHPGRASTAYQVAKPASSLRPSGIGIVSFRSTRTGSESPGHSPVRTGNPRPSPPHGGVKSFSQARAEAARTEGARDEEEAEEGERVEAKRPISAPVSRTTFNLPSAQRPLAAATAGGGGGPKALKSFTQQRQAVQQASAAAAEDATEERDKVMKTRTAHPTVDAPPVGTNAQVKARMSVPHSPMNRGRDAAANEQDDER